MIPRVLLCAGASGSGKTLITCGILQALKNRGLKVASFKCGPDYIDPVFHTRVIGTRSRNLDTFFAGEEIVRYLLAENTKDMDIAIMEGVMGYYDGAGGTTTKASAYDLTRTTETPAVLIVNSKGMSLSVIAYIKGFMEYRKDSRIKGVILNQMTGMLYPRMKKAIEEELDIKVLGYVPKVSDCIIESRHLGLVMPEEIEDFHERLMKLADILEETLDLDKLIALAGEAPDISCEKPWNEDSSYNFKTDEKVRIAVSQDEAFCFMYEDNLRLLEKMGAEIVYFSPVHDICIPENTDGMILYGGYPELYADSLEGNSSMRESVRKAYEEGMPVMAECGGFMYLHDTFEDMNGKPHKGAGVIKGKAYKTSELGRFGYITLTENNSKTFGRNTGSSPAHEFHYFDSDNCGSDFTAAKPFSIRKWQCLHSEENLLAGFPHFYYYGNPEIPEAFLMKALEFKKERN